METFDSIHPVPAAWLRDSDLAPFVPAYVRRLLERRYAHGTVRAYVCAASRTSHIGRAGAEFARKILTTRSSGTSLTTTCRAALALRRYSAPVIKSGLRCGSC